MHFFHLHIPINKAIMNIALVIIEYFLGFFSDCQISIETDFLNSGAATPEFSLFVRLKSRCCCAEIFSFLKGSLSNGVGE